MTEFNNTNLEKILKDGYEDLCKPVFIIKFGNEKIGEANTLEYAKSIADNYIKEALKKFNNDHLSIFLHSIFIYEEKDKNIVDCRLLVEKKYNKEKYLIWKKIMYPHDEDEKDEIIGEPIIGEICYYTCWCFRFGH